MVMDLAASTGTVAEAPLWVRLGFPDEATYNAFVAGGGDPTAPYQPTPQPMPALGGMDIFSTANAQNLAKADPGTISAAPMPVPDATGMVSAGAGAAPMTGVRNSLLNPLPTPQPQPTPDPYGYSRLSPMGAPGSLREEAIQTGAQGYGGITDPIMGAISAVEQPVTSAIRTAREPVLDVAQMAGESGALGAIPGFGLIPQQYQGDVARTAADLALPQSAFELGLEATPFGFAGDARRALDELPLGAAESLVRGTPTDAGLLAGPGVGRPVPAPRPGLAGAADEFPDEAVSGPGSPPPSPVAEGVPPVAPSAAPTDVMAQPDPVAKLTDLVNQARKLPDETETLRTQRRRQQAAIIAETLQRGGRSAEAFRQAQASLAGELPRAAFEPPATSFTPQEIQGFRNAIGEAGLRPFEELNTNNALQKVLDGRLNEVQRNEIDLLDRVFGTDLSLAVAQKAAPPSLRDKLHEFWLANILSGHETAIRNVMGNTAAALQAPIERTFSAAIDPAAARLSGRETERFWQEVPEQLIGMAQGFPKGVEGALRAFKTGLGEAALTESASRAPAIQGLKGRIIRIPLTALEAMDAFFGSINFEGARRALAVREARKEGLKGEALEARIAELLADTPEELVDAATEEKLVRLFRDDPSVVGNWIMEGRQKVPALRWLVPFARTPDRLIAYGVRRSPLGLLDFGMWNRLVKGNPEAVDDLAATLMGSSVAMSLGALMATGQMDITGAVPDSPAARDAFFRAGKQPFSVKVPGVGWIEYGQIPGLDVALTSLASAKEAFEEGESPDDAIAQLGANIASNIFNRSYVSGLADFIGIFAGGGFEDPVDAGQRWASRQLSGFVPGSALGRQGSQFFDQAVYQPEGIEEQVASGIGAGGIAGVPPRLTAFGEEADRPLPTGFQVSPDRQTEVDQELERIGVEVTFVGDSIGGRELSREEKAEYQREAGQLTLRRLEQLIGTTVYQRMPDVLKEQTIRNVMRQARDAARQLISLRHAREQVEQMRQGTQ